ncbi:MAG: dihydroorotase [Cyanobium sp.]
MTRSSASPAPFPPPAAADSQGECTRLLRGVNLLEAQGQPARTADVLIRGGLLAWISPAAPGSGESGQQAPLAPESAGMIEASDLWLGPALVDPHSSLEDPLLGRAETLESLAAAAAAGGYGTVALLPWGPVWRDRPERLGLHWPAPLQLLLWGSFSQAGEDRELAGHADQIAAGAIGLACADQLPPLPLLERGLRLAEMGDHPVLLPPRDGSLCQQGFVRERVEALRAGWPVDPVASESLPLELILGLRQLLPQAPLRMMNVSTREAVLRLEQHPAPPPASVHWWHLVADSQRLDPVEGGWRTVPSLGGPQDRQALIEALADGRLRAVAVHHQALDGEEQLLPLDQRRPGLAGHGSVLPLLWQALVVENGWRPDQLWQVLCWGPADFLGLTPARLEAPTRRWILFDPMAPETSGDAQAGSLAANRPPRISGGRGALVASGLRGTGGWWAPGFPKR